MRNPARAAVLAVVVWIAGCAAPPMVQPDEYEEPAIETPTPMVEYPPIEPVEPPPVPATAGPAPPPAAPSTPPADATAPTVQPTPSRPPAAVPAVPVPAELSAEEQLLNGLLADLARYGSLSGDDMRRELNAMTQTLARQRTDANRVRLAVLYTLTRANPQDDQRALQLLDNVAKSGPGSPAVKQIALVLQLQITDRVRAVREEQQKADAAIQKLEALRAMERSLLRDRIRGGGGGAGGGGGSSGGGGGGGGGGGAGGG